MKTEFILGISTLLMSGILPLFAQVVPKDVVILPYIVAGTSAGIPEIQTEITIVNPNLGAATIFLEFFDQNGALLPLGLRDMIRDTKFDPSSVFTLSVVGNGTLVLETLETRDRKTGWGRINSSNPVTAAQTLKYFTRQSEPAVSTVHGATTERSADRFLVPVTVDLGAATRVNTGIAITNTGNVQTTLDILLADSAGAIKDRQTVSLAPKSQKALFINELFRDFFKTTSKFRGSLYVISSKPVVGLGVQQFESPNGLFFSNFPVIEIAGTTVP